ncbi:hypothetical protein KCP71_15805 [Salmonella enterica subsp. enterica]|nr:hypothetical protein KCP71_15805 [Salmonella enterica subsp. enterica]
MPDCCLIPQWANALRMGCDLSSYSRCKAVYDACVQLRRLLPPRRKINKIKSRPERRMTMTHVTSAIIVGGGIGGAATTRCRCAAG